MSDSLPDPTQNAPEPNPAVDPAANANPAAPTINIDEVMAGYEAQRMEQQQVIRDMQAKIEELASRPSTAANERRVSDAEDLRSSEEKKLDELNRTVSELRKHQEDQARRQIAADNAARVQAALSDASDVVDAMVAGNAVAKDNPALARKIKKAILEEYGPRIRERPSTHGISTEHVRNSFLRELREHQEISASWNGRKADVADAVKAAASNAVDAGKGMTVAPNEGKPTLSPNDPDYWKQKRQTREAAFKRYAGT